MLYTYIHHKEYSKVSQDVAHLYEHLVIYSFHSYVESLGIHPGLTGGFSGDTFEHIVFLNAIFYDKKVADAYEHFLASPELIDRSLISRMLLECESEDRVTLILQDEAEFDTQLGLLMAMPWINNDSTVPHSIDETSITKSPFETKRNAKEFKNVALGFYADIDTLNLEEQILLLRLSVVVGDIIELALRRSIQGAYCAGRTPVSIDSTNMVGGTHLRLKKNISLGIIRDIAEGALQSINVQTFKSLIAAQFEEFADRATWKSFAIEYYRYTGLIASNEYISSLATPERVTNVISKLKIHVRVMQKGDEEWFS